MRPTTSVGSGGAAGNVRLTADEWLGRLQGVLGGKKLSNPDGSTNEQPLLLYSKSLTIASGNIGTYFAQFIPPGYYDTVRIVVTSKTGFSVTSPVYGRYEAIKAPEGAYAFNAASQSQFMTLHPPQIFGLVNPSTGAGTLGLNENEQMRQMPLTNSPLAVWMWDSFSAPEAVETVITALFMTLRH
jgi:hypothetical protein